MHVEIENVLLMSYRRLKYFIFINQYPCLFWESEDVGGQINCL